ncbi:MAG: hypothetical protein A2289_00095 [Deltaproteobacteria bacterium RIFOXYA12_FULL_58_15]|nr:MAG: hypothetical protein A2289_00095 [Deltaproteobacteria bacterium RIFOXYA12_FULL_58_15]
MRRFGWFPTTLGIVCLGLGFGFGCAEETPPITNPHYNGGDPLIGGDTKGDDTLTGDTRLGDGGGPGGQGVIYAMSGTFQYVATFHTSSLQVSFGPRRASDPNCSVVDAGACSKTTCVSGGARPSAGAIAVTGGLQTPVASPDSNGIYTVSGLASSQSLFSTGTSLSVTATGADVPAFTESVVTPVSITVSSPTFTTGAITVDTSADLSVAWSGATAGEVLLVAGGTISASSSTVVMYCRYDAVDGSGTVPASILSGFSSVDTHSVLAVGLASVNEFTLGNWDVRILAHQVADGGGSSIGFAAGRAEFQ